MTELETDLIDDLVRRKRRCLEHLAAMGEQQLQLVRRGSVTELLDLLAAKQQLLFQLERIERQLDPFRNQDPNQRLWRSADQRQQCAAAISDCEKLLARIIAQEKQSETELTRRRDQLAARLEQTWSAGEARALYHARPQPRASRLDLTSEQ
ncbi:MAG: hypothetical protein ACUVUC_08620 [Thermoguttaceae bacterium]